MITNLLLHYNPSYNEQISVCAPHYSSWEKDGIKFFNFLGNDLRQLEALSRRFRLIQYNRGQDDVKFGGPKRIVYVVGLLKYGAPSWLTATRIRLHL